MDSFVCDKCKKTFTSQVKLKRHCTSTKCSTGKKFLCNFCDYETTRNDNLQTHQLKCKNNPKYIDYQPSEIEKLKEIIKQKNERIRQLENIINGTKPIDSSLKHLSRDGNPFTLDFVQKQIEKFTYELFCQGEQGIINFVILIFEGEFNYVLRDLSRSKFAFLNENHIWEYDNEATFLISCVFKSLKEIYNEYYDKNRIMYKSDPELANTIDDKVRNILYAINHEKSDYKNKVSKTITNRLKKVIKKN